MSDSEQAALVETLRRALRAMSEWSASRRLDYRVLIGLKNRRAEFTRDFEGEAEPEPDAVTRLDAQPLARLLYVLHHTDEICLDVPTARSITGTPSIDTLVRVMKEAEAQGFAKRWPGASPKELSEADRDSVAGLRLTDDGRKQLELLHLVPA